MPDVPWNNAVLKTSTLKIDASAVHGTWATAVSAALRELNSLFGPNGVNVSLTAGSPAQVVVALTDGPYTFPVEGVNQSGTLRTDVLHGATRSLDAQLGNNTSRDRAYIFLPQHPRANPRERTSREVGEPIMRVIIAHEFVHALGLGAHDPAFNGLFAESWTPNTAGKSSEDTVSPFGTSAKLPPLILSGDTVSRLRALWP